MARKSPTSSVIKRLFAKSGNKCAYENCNNTLVDDEGNVLGEICHMEAASEKGPRYNKNSDDDYRRSYDNLILLCERHHKIVDNNPQKYSANRLKQLKEIHQNKNSNSDFEISKKTLEKVIHKVQMQFVQLNTNQGSGQQYILNADTINLDTRNNEEENEPKKSIKRSLKDRFDLIATVLSIISVFLTILSRSAGVLPNLNPHINSLLICSTVSFMILFGYISWVRTYKKDFLYSRKLRSYSKVIFWCIPFLSFIIWFTFLRLTPLELENRNMFIELGNYYYDREHLRNLALEPYRNALKLDPSQLEIIERVKKLEE